MLLKRSQKSGGGGWSVPGGGLDPDEDPIKGIEREVMEEAGVAISQIEPIKLIVFKENSDSVLLIAYKAVTDQSNITLNWEHDEWKWISKEDALQENLSEMLKEFIRLS